MKNSKNAGDSDKALQIKKNYASKHKTVANNKPP